MPDCLEADRTVPDGLCLWPIGDPLADEFRFCRLLVARPGEPWCAEHRARAWRTPEDLVADRKAWLREQRRRRQPPEHAA